MVTQFSEISIVSFLTTGVAIVLALLTVRRRKAPGNVALALLMAAIAFWTFARGFEAAAVDMAWKVFWGKSEYFGIVSVPILWFLFVFQYTRRDRWLTSRNVVLLWVIPVITVVMAATNGWHGLMWSNIAPSPGRETEVLIYTHGTWFWVHAAYSYMLMVFGAFQLLKTTFANIRMYRLQSLSIMVAVLIPWVGNGIYLLGYSPIPGLDLTPLAFLVSGVVIAWSLLRHSFLDIVPMARGMLFENMDDGFIVLDSQNRIVDINTAARGLLDKSNESVVGKNADEVIPGLSDIGSGTQEQPVSEAELVMGNESAPRVLDCKFNLLRNRHGAPTGRLILLRDISSKKEAEQALLESEERYRQLVAHAPAGIYEIDFLEQKFLSVNDIAVEYSGYTREELLSLSPLDILTEESRKVFLERLNSLFSGESVPETVEYKIKRKDGSELWVILNTRMVYEAGKPKGATVVVHNITDRKRVEEALRESEEKYRLLVENASDAIFIAQDEVVKFPNPRTTEIVGYSPEELAGIPFTRLIHPEDRDTVLDRHKRRLQAEELLSSYSFRVISKAGEEVWVDLNTVVITWEGRPANLNFLRDITPQRKLEAQLMHAQKMEAVGTMASGIAHNFRNILAAISMHSQAMEMKYKEDKTLQEMSRVFVDYVERGSQLVSSLTQFSRKKGDKIFHPLDLSEMTEETYQLTSESFDKMIHVSMDARESLPIMGDYSGIGQVLMNLCTNARDAMPEGGELQIRAVKEGDNALVVVSDTGQGMDRKTQKRCFDPFFTTKGVDKGTGLGLSTAFGIMQEHGGKIDVYSELGQGTTFRLQFPLAPAEGAERPDTPEEVIHGNGQKILIVDDEIEICKVMVDLIEVLGYDGAYGSTGKEGIEKFQNWQPDLVLLDRSMPDMDGMTGAAKMIDLDPDAKIIIMSGYEADGPSGIDGEEEKLLKGYITKPVDMGKLSRLLADILS